MKKIISLSVMAVLLTACGGNKLELDLEKVQNAVAEEALKKKSIEEGDYTKEDIEVVKVCESVELDETKDDFKGQYIVDWKTNDDKYELDFSMNSDYEVGYSSSRLKPIEDRCISVE
ncbi:hypothetical protein [Halobacillus ihumii]|uniref:hypothetical protein n=1 Tax=Halobacillus ihumii TaxID=2686092 RepID=UPI0013D3390F|nr:hypothetical protein [Halobacillus ihumii]